MHNEPVSTDIDFEMTDLEPCETIVSFLHHGTAFSAAYEVDGGLDGGTVFLAPKAQPEGWSYAALRTLLVDACRSENRTLAGMPAPIKAAIAIGDVCVEIAR